MSESLKDFLERYAKPIDNGLSIRIAAHLESIRNNGYTTLSQEESVTGEVVVFYPHEEQKDKNAVNRKFLDNHDIIGIISVGCRTAKKE